jgi:PAS domain S-box-containing protein
MMRLIREQAALDLFARTVPHVFWRANSDGSFLYLSPQFAEITGNRGTSLEEKLGSVHPEDRLDFIASQKPPADADEVSVKFRLRHADGQHRWMLSTRHAVRDRTGRILRWVGSLVDIHSEMEAREELRYLSENLQATINARREELRLNDERFEALFHDLNVAYAEADIRVAKILMDSVKADGIAYFSEISRLNPSLLERALASIKILNSNPALAAMLRYDDSKELMSKPLSMLIKDSRRLLLSELEAIFTERRHFTTFATFMSKDGVEVPVAIGVNFTADWSTCIATHLDITERQKAHEVMIAAREELARANRLTAVGAMSASLAHELNQPILAMTVDAQTSVRWLKKAVPAYEKAREALERVVYNARRMADIAKSTGERSIRADRDVGQIELLKAMEETRELVEREIVKRGIRLVWRLETATAIVVADKVEVQQVLVNLINNAADAINSIKERGEIVIRLSAVGEKFRLSVEDDGPGISEEQIKSVFTPFFTTKPGGMGMGLQICRSILEGYGSELKVENRSEGGASFSFLLSPADADVSEQGTFGAAATDNIITVDAISPGRASTE